MNTSQASEVLLKKIYGYILSHAISAVTALNIPEIIAKNQLHIDEIAKKTDLSVESLARLMRFLVSEDIFESPQKDYYKNNATSYLLTNNAENSLGYVARLHTSELWQSLWLSLPEVIKQNKSAMHCNSDKSIFDYFKDTQQLPNSLFLFNMAMENLNNMDAQHFLDHYDVNDYHSIIDIAGGTGALIKTLRKKYLQKKLALFEKEIVVDCIDLQSDIEVISGDFFKEIPKGFDLYIMRHIIHNWDDENAVKLLMKCGKSMHDNSKLCIIECINDEKNHSNIQKYRDMTMLVTMPSGKERTLSEFDAILAKAGFSINKVIKIHPAMNIIECTPIGRL